MFLPASSTHGTLSGVGFTKDKDGNVELWGQYFVRNYCGRVSAAPEYRYGKAVKEEKDFIIDSSGYCRVKRWSKRPCDDCDEPIDSHEVCKR